MAGYLARGTAGTFGIKIAYSGLSFLVGLILARTLGVAGYGTFAYALAWVVVLSAPSGLGLDKLIVRQVAAHHSKSEWGEISRLLREANSLTFAISLGVALVAGLFALAFSNGDARPALATFGVALLLLPVLNLTRLRQAAMQGLGHAVAGQMPEMLLQPLLFVCFLTAANFVSGASAPLAMALGVIASGIALIAGGRILNSFLAPGAAAVASADWRAWAGSVLPFVALNSLQIANSRIATLIVGAIKGPDAVGVYAVAARWAEYISFFLAALVPVLAPVITRLYLNQDIPQLQRVLTLSTRLVFLVTAPVALVFIGFGNWLLGIYGPDFVQGSTALAILSAAQLVSVAAGAVAWLLFMTGHERDATISLAVSIVATALLSAALVPAWGINGAAIADMTGLVIWNGSMAFFAYRKIGIDPTVLGIMLPRGQR